MKKVITVLAVLALVAGFAFAAADLTLTTNVHRIAPVFKIEFDNNASTSKGTVDGTNVTLNDSIADGNISVVFVVSQNGGKDLDNGGASVSGYSRYGISSGTDVTLTITCTQFANGNEVSKAPTLSAAYKPVEQSNSNKLVFPSNPATVVPGESATETSISLVPQFKGKKVVNQGIAAITAAWPQKDDLAMGTYTADITLSYVAN